MSVQTQYPASDEHASADKTKSILTLVTLNDFEQHHSAFQLVDVVSLRVTFMNCVKTGSRTIKLSL